MSTAGILVIGNEVLSGKVEEENARFLIRELRALGVELNRIAIIRDDVPAIAREARDMMACYDHVFTSGGVGSTHDDMTMEGIAASAGVPLVRHPRLEALLRAHYGVRATPSVLRMANVPEGTVLLGEDELPFPVVTFRNAYVLPGVPQFLRAKFEVLRSRFQHPPFVLRQIFVNVGEDRIADLMRDTAAELPGLEIGSYPRFDTDEYRVKITIEAKEVNLVEQGVQRLLAGLEPSVIVRIS